MTVTSTVPADREPSGLEPEERAELERATAELMAHLSRADEAPEGWVQSAIPLIAAEIRWDNGNWASCIADIEGWLKFEEDLPFHSRDVLAKTISRGLGFDEPSGAFRGGLSDLHLSDAGLEALHARLERAVRHQRGFIEVEQIEVGETTSVAESAWEESWEEEAEIEPSSGPIAAKAQVWNINDLSARAERRKLNLSPSYQRADVWPTADAQLLIESILRGIPLPSVIVLRPQSDPNGPYEVVDGKQRLTSILRFIGAHPEAVSLIKRVEREQRIDLLDLFKRDYPKFKIAWKAATGQVLTSTIERELYFPFRLSSSDTALRGGLEHFRGKYYSQIRREDVDVAEERVEVEDLFERVTEYKIPVIEYLRASPRQIHEVFNLYNKQGKHLNAEEIRNALFHELDLMRGLLVASGDNTDLEAVAPFLSARWATIALVAQALDDLGVGSVRYRRTKVLSWAVSLLVDDSRDEQSGKPKRLATARQIDSLLNRIQRDEYDELRDGRALLDLFGLLAESIVALAREADAWAPGFKDGSRGTTWQDLPLVGTLLGLTAARAVLGDQADERLRSRLAELDRASSSDPRWERPLKTQTDTQWKYISAVALGTMRILGVDPVEASATLNWRFGHSGIQALLAIEAMSR